MSTSKSSTDSDRIAVGRVTAPQGLSGEVRVFPLTDFPERFSERKAIGVEWPTGEFAVRAIRASRMHKGLVILSLEGVDDRDAAERLRGAVLSVARAEMPPLPPGEYYVADLLGCEVWSTAGDRLGRLHDVLQTGANDVYVVARDDDEDGAVPAFEHARPSRSPLLIPATREVVREVDVAGGRIVVHPLPGLLE